MGMTPSVGAQWDLLAVPGLSDSSHTPVFPYTENQTFPEHRVTKKPFLTGLYTPRVCL